MRTERVAIENFRAARNVEFLLGPSNCLVGDNGAGKSTLLAALNVFFQHSRHSQTDTVKLSEEDFTDRNTGHPIRVSITFRELSEAAATELGHYVRQGKLTIVAEATWSEIDGYAKVSHIGERLAIKKFAPFFEAIDAKAKVAEQRVIYSEIREATPDLPAATTGRAMFDALREYEENHSELCEPIPSRSDFFGCVAAGGKLALHVKWVYIPPVHNASDEQTDSVKNAFNELLQLTVSRSMGFDARVKEIAQQAKVELDSIAEEQSGALATLESSLQQSIVRFGPPDTVLQIKWDTDLGNLVSVKPPFARTSLGDSRFLGEVARQGHAVQRAYIAALLHHLAECEDSGPTLILGFEEPELFQHPPQVDRLTRTLRELSETGQVILTTHNPKFICLEHLDSIRLIRRCDVNGFVPCSTNSAEINLALGNDASESTPVEHERVLTRIASVFTPTLTEMFFSRFAVFLEGVEDHAILTAAAELSGRLAALEEAEINFFPVEGKTELPKAFAIARAFQIPCVVVYDNDSRHSGDAKDQSAERNRQMQRVGGVPDCDIEDFPNSIELRGSTIAWDDDIQSEIAQVMSEDAWNQTVQAIAKRTGARMKNGVCKNSRVLAEAVCEAYQADSSLPPLEKMLDLIIDTACGRRAPDTGIAEVAGGEVMKPTDIATRSSTL